jgi:hypothetical protein
LVRSIENHIAQRIQRNIKSDADAVREEPGSCNFTAEESSRVAAENSSSAENVDSCGLRAMERPRRTFRGTEDSSPARKIRKTTADGSPSGAGASRRSTSTSLAASSTSEGVLAINNVKRDFILFFSCVRVYFVLCVVILLSFVLDITNQATKMKMKISDRTQPGTGTVAPRSGSLYINCAYTCMNTCVNF